MRLILVFIQTRLVFIQKHAPSAPATPYWVSLPPHYARYTHCRCLEGMINCVLLSEISPVYFRALGHKQPNAGMSYFSFGGQVAVRFNGGADKDVIYLGPGIHEVKGGVFKVPSGKTVHFKPVR
jgi:hypothetical protein